MVRHYTRNHLIQAILAVLGKEYECRHKGHGRAGRLLEDLLGIDGGNHDVADAVGFEIKTSSSGNTPITLFHKDPRPRGGKNQLGAVAHLVHRYGWHGEYRGEAIKSFRATIYGQWSNTRGDITLKAQADDHKICIMHGQKELAWWDSNELVGIASAKLRNIMYVNAQTLPDGRVCFTDAQIFETFSPLKLLNAINRGIIAIDFDARSNPGKKSIRNHGTKFRIKEKDILQIYQKISKIPLLNE